MLVKALLTGSILSVLAGGIVYYGTEGVVGNAPAKEAPAKVESNERVGDHVDFDETINAEVKEKTAEKTADLKKKAHLEKKAEAAARRKAAAERKKKTAEAKKKAAEAKAGKTETATTQEVEKVVEATDPSKTKWLDHYLKPNDKAKDAPAEMQKDMQEMPSENMSETANEGKVAKADLVVEDRMQTSDDSEKAMSEKKSMAEKAPMTKKDMMAHKQDKKAKKQSGQSTRDDILRIMNGAAKRPVKDKAIIDAARKDGPDSGFLPAENVKQPREFKRRQPKMQNLPRAKADYSRILEEANKIEIVELRDLAMLEILDKALDCGHTGQAADIITELSTPESRDTARARIGVSLAKIHEAEAAFAVMDEIEIAESASAIRLEIISALMATRAEHAQQ